MVVYWYIGYVFLLFVNWRYFEKDENLGCDSYILLSNYVDVFKIVKLLVEVVFCSVVVLCNI